MDCSSHSLAAFTPAPLQFWIFEILDFTFLNLENFLLVFYLYTCLHRIGYFGNLQFIIFIYHKYYTLQYFWGYTLILVNSMGALSKYLFLQLFPHSIKVFCRQYLPFPRSQSNRPIRQFPAVN